MPIDYRSDVQITASDLAAVFQKSGIRRPVEDLGRLQTMLDRASLIVTAWDGEALVGVARAITDFCYCCYLSDLAVDQGYQRQGIGTELIRQAREAAGEQCTLVLVSAPEAAGFYGKIGMEPIESGWLIRRTQ